MMGGLVLSSGELEIDLESGGTTSEEEKTNDLVLAYGQNKKLLNRVWSSPLSFDGFVNSLKFGEAAENVELLIDKNSEGEEGQQSMCFVNKKKVEDKHKPKKSRKPSKPPRPPKGPALDAADQKLVQEITELAMRKRARIEQIKTLKKMKAAKTSSWNSGITSMIITILFFCIIIFQGLWFTKNGSVLLQGSPAPAVTGNDGFISVQFYKNSSAYE